jgi:hypothetical protein
MLIIIGQPQPNLPSDAGEKTIANLDKLRYANGTIPTAELRYFYIYDITSDTIVVIIEEECKRLCKDMQQYLEMVHYWKRVSLL